ncbi:hypothetical protein SM124_13465 [Bacillus sp. 31A1R]|uniref:Uncharacterized protein n=1 Tax=Robertmurraya mangrovi TaxID=3098077 RepID=A0ABU5J021_9BACI|nr:hypothetical protein [Bacillus sp. 31A1R]MDZ5472736.1 hypothetical protein [Bacillus sp. 31A1R]
MMKKVTKSNKQYIFSSSVSETNKENEFTVEFFQCTPEMNQEDNPYKVTNNFDELLNFLEELEETSI